MAQQHPGEDRDQHDPERGQRVGHVPAADSADRVAEFGTARRRLGGLGSLLTVPSSPRPPGRHPPLSTIRRSPGSSPAAPDPRRGRVRPVHLRALVRRPPSRRRRPPRPGRARRSPTRAGRPLAGQLVPPGPQRRSSPGLDLVGRHLRLQRGRLGAVLVGVAEDADGVQPRAVQEVASRPGRPRSRRGSRQMTLERMPGLGAVAADRCRAGPGSSRCHRSGASGAARRGRSAGRTGRSTARPSAVEVRTSTRPGRISAGCR